MNSQRSVRARAQDRARRRAQSGARVSQRRRHAGVLHVGRRRAPHRRHAASSYIDFCMSFGPLILGHRDPAVAGAVHEAVDRGWSFGACEPYSLALAEWILARVPWVERLRFVSSGTEAVMSALRVARAATGSLERAQVRRLLSRPCRSDARHAPAVASPDRRRRRAPGFPTARWRTRSSRRSTTKRRSTTHSRRRGRDLAAVILEPVPANYGLLPQRQAWLQHLVARCRERRHAPHRRRGHHRISQRPGGRRGRVRRSYPDLVCYGKVIGGGFPVAGYGGRADLHESRRAGGTCLSGRNAQRESGRHARRSRDARADGGSRRMDRARAPDRGVRPATCRTARRIRVGSRRRAPRVDLLDSSQARRGDTIRRPDRIPADQADVVSRVLPRGARRTASICRRLPTKSVSCRWRTTT